MVFDNRILIAALIGWAIAQIIKVPLEYLQTKRWNWALFFSPGGMPSSHSALVTGLGLAIGLYYGFDSALFAIAVVIGMVVIYDATGIRWQAGKQAEIINAMINDLAAGHPLREEQLKEVLGHTPLEVLGGVLLGLVSALLVWIFWR
jgi:acid phosphatase family membrane protein YuiD